VPNRPKEPIRQGWFWAGVAALVFAGSPWYLRSGSFEPILLGLPYWVWISIALSLVFCFYVRWACLNLWGLEDEEDGPESRGGSAR